MSLEIYFMHTTPLSEPERQLLAPHSTKANAFCELGRKKIGKNEPCSPQKAFAFVEYGTRSCLSGSDRGVMGCFHWAIGLHLKQISCLPLAIRKKEGKNLLSRPMKHMKLVSHDIRWCHKFQYKPYWLTEKKQEVFHLEAWNLLQVTFRYNWPLIKYSNKSLLLKHCFFFFFWFLDGEWVSFENFEFGEKNGAWAKRGKSPSYSCS